MNVYLEFQFFFFFVYTSAPLTQSPDSVPAAESTADLMVERALGHDVA